MKGRVLLTLGTVVVVMLVVLASFPSVVSSTAKMDSTLSSFKNTRDTVHYVAPLLEDIIVFIYHFRLARANFLHNVSTGPNISPHGVNSVDHPLLFVRSIQLYLKAVIWMLFWTEVASGLGWE